jgi:hypothetical protein
MEPRFVKGGSMKKFLFSWSPVQIIICAGALCVVAGLVNNFVEVVYAQPSCPNLTVRENSLCVTQAKSCRMVGSVCSAVGEYVYHGKFQCDEPSVGKTYKGSGNLAPCYDTFDCVLDTLSGKCIQNANSPAEAVDAATNKSVDCVGG